MFFGTLLIYKQSLGYVLECYVIYLFYIYESIFLVCLLIICSTLLHSHYDYYIFKCDPVTGVLAHLMITLR